MMQGSFSHLGYHYPTFLSVDEHHETEDGKSRLRAEQEKSRLHARISSCSILETSVCVNAYIVEISTFAYDVRLDCLI